MVKRIKSYNDYLKKENIRLQLIIDSPECPPHLKRAYSSTIAKNNYTIRRRFTKYHSDNSATNLGIF